MLEEIATHLDDTIDTLMQEGLTIDQAEREAMARLGSPEELGRNLRRTHQTTRRLLAAAGGGVWKGFEGLVAGYLIAFVWMLPITFAAALVLQAVAAATGGNLTGTANVVLAYAPVLACGALWLAARWATRAVARVSWRREHTVRVPIAALGFTAVAIAVVTFPADQSWLSVIATMLMPFAFAAGAMSAGGRADGSPWVELHWPSRLPSRRKLLLGVIVISIAVPVLATLVDQALFSDAGTGTGEANPTTPSVTTRWRYTDIGQAQVAARSLPVEADWPEQDGWTLARFADDAVDWSALPGLQLELWRATGEDTETATLVDPERGPYRVIPVADPWATPRVAVPTGTPAGGAYLLFAVSVDPETGERTVVGEPWSGDATFHGTLLDWFAAL